MDEAIIFASEREISKKLSSDTEKEITLAWRSDEEFKKLKGTLLMFQAIIQVAETRQVKEGTVWHWLKILKDVAYGVLSEFSFESMGQTMAVQIRVMKKVFNFFSRSNALAFRSKMAHKFKEIDGRLDQTERDMKMFNLTGGNEIDDSTSKMDREIHAYLDDPEIVNN